MSGGELVKNISAYVTKQENIRWHKREKEAFMFSWGKSLRQL